MNQPEDAERAFYEAFMAHDTEAMMRVWSAEDPVVCIHPGMPRLEGVEAIRASWAELFGAASARAELPRLQIQPLSRAQSEGLAVHMVVERFMAGGEVGTVFAVNSFRRGAGGWRIVAHHASPGWSERVPPHGPLH